MPSYLADKRITSFKAVERELQVLTYVDFGVWHKVQRLLTKYDYPPDLEKKAAELVLQQTELFSSESGM